MLDHKYARAWVFPGVGVRPCGQETSLFQRFEDLFRQRFQLTSQISGRNLLPFIENQPSEFPEGLDEQLLSMSFACACVDMLRQEKMDAQIIAGNSFGVYPAIFAAGALSYEQAVNILTVAFRQMEAAGAGKACSLCAIVGMSGPECQEIIGATGLSSVLRINSNNHTCHIYSGSSTDIANFSDACQAAGALSAAILPVALPYHHPFYTAGVSAAFTDQVRALPWRRPQIPVVSTIDFQVLQTESELADYVSRQIFQPIDWSGTVAALYALGVEELFECGLGISLTQNARFIEGVGRWHNCKTMSRRIAVHE